MKKFLILLTVVFLSMFMFGCDNKLETEKIVESSTSDETVESTKVEETLISSESEEELESSETEEIVEQSTFEEPVETTKTEETVETTEMVVSSESAKESTDETTTSAERTLKSISVKINPTKTSYFEGDTLDMTGLTLVASYSDNTTETITSGFSCNPTTLSDTGSKTITVSYDGKTTTFAVTVSAVTLTSIAIGTNPSKTTYTVGDTLDTSGLALTAAYSNGKTEAVTSGFTVDTTTLSEEGTKTVTVSYGGKSITYTVTVEKPVAIVGDTITFGSLTWRVLAVNGTKVLLITKDIVTSKNYNDVDTDDFNPVTWETCTLRTWLNNSFLTTYIPSSTDRAKIITTTVVNDDNPTYGTEGGNTTYDKVFLLSIAEVKTYFPSEAARVTYYNGEVSWWWLRSPGEESYRATFVYDNGEIDIEGWLAVTGCRVRPAMWVDLGQ